MSADAGGATVAPLVVTTDVDPAQIERESEAFARSLPAGVWAARSGRGIEVFSYDAVEAVYLDTAFRAGVIKLMMDMGFDPRRITGGGANLQANDGPTHRPLRQLVGRWFTPRQIERLRTRVDELTTRLLEPMTADGGGDFLALSRTIPGTVFCWMVGLPDSHGDHIYDLSATLLKTFAGRREDADGIARAAIELRGIVEALIADKRRDPGDDLTSVLLSAGDSGTIRDEDVYSLLFELLAASTDNTTHALCLMLATLASRPHVLRQVRADPSLTPKVVEECMRLDPRVRVDSAWCVADTDLLGLPVAAGERVWQHIAAAHRDPDRFADPDTFSLERKTVSQLGFGAGRHFCVGAALARMELAVVLDAVARSWDSYTLGSAARIRRGMNAQVEALPVQCAPRSSR